MWLAIRLFVQLAFASVASLVVWSKDVSRRYGLYIDCVELAIDRSLSLPPTPLPSDPPRGPYSSMASSEAGSNSSTSIPPLGVSWVLVGGSSGGEVLPRCLHPFASPRAACSFGQALSCAKWRPLL